MAEDPKTPETQVPAAPAPTGEADPNAAPHAPDSPPPGDSPGEAPSGFGPEGSDAPKKVVKVKRVIVKRVGLFGAVAQSVKSDKSHVKMWGWLFIASMIGLTISSVGIFKIWMKHKAEQAVIKIQQESSPEELAKKEAAEKKKQGAEYIARNLSLGVFQFQMKKMSVEPEPKDIQNIAQIEITVLCDSLKTKEYLSSHLNQVRDQITQALIGFTRKDLMSSTGKKSIQEKILIKVNVSLPDGRVERVFFTKFILS